MPERQRKIVLATSNAGKIREIARLLDGLDIEVIAQSALGVTDAEETGSTFAENSLIKARHASAATGLPALADDSGLAVNALDGRPGVYSARYAGVDATDDDNIDKLLAELADVDDAARGAEFHCVMSLVMPGEVEAQVATGVWQGSILRQKSGNGGFGYDPVFLDPASGLSAAALTAGQKAARSHRGKALHAMLPMLRESLS